MKTSNFEVNLKTYSSDTFSDGELKLFKDCAKDIYFMLKHHFDKPPRYKRPYNSLEAHKMAFEKQLTCPIDYYCFKDDNVMIFLDYKSRGHFLTVGVTGTKMPKFISERWTSPDAFSAGFDFYGRFMPTEFRSAVIMYHNLVYNYLQGKFAGVEFTQFNDEKVKVFPVVDA